MYARTLTEDYHYRIYAMISYIGSQGIRATECLIDSQGDRSKTPLNSNAHLVFLVLFAILYERIHMREDLVGKHNIFNPFSPHRPHLPQVSYKQQITSVQQHLLPSSNPATSTTSTANGVYSALHRAGARSRILDPSLPVASTNTSWRRLRRLEGRWFAIVEFVLTTC